MKKLLPFLALPVIIFILSVQATPSIPRKNMDPAFSDITVTSSSSHLLLFAMLTNSYTDEMLQGLHSGVPIEFSFFVELTPTEQGWNSDNRLSIDSMHRLSYDTIREDYTVEIEESGKRFFTFEDLTAAKKAANEINGLKVIRLEQLQPDTAYTLRIRAELYKKNLPMGLHKIIPFTSWWDIQTQWHTIAFTL